MTNIPIMMDNYDAINLLDDEQAGMLLKALFKYNRGEEVTGLPAPVMIIFSYMKGQIDRMEKAYEKKCEKNRENIRKRWDTTVYDRIQSNTNEYESIPNDTKQYQTIPTKSKSKSKDTLPSIIDEEPVKSAWSEFKEMRSKIKKPLTEGAITRAKATLENLSHGDKDLAVKILQQSVDHCWQGLFELKTPVIKKPNSFFDFAQRNDDLDALVRAEL